MSDFQGRGPEITQLGEALKEGGEQAAVSVIHGMGGVGKSALAIHVGHCLADAFPNGRLLVELAGTSPEPLSPVAAMGKIIQALLPQERLPDDDREATERLYHGVLSGRRVLILLDNARDTEQVRPLLKWLPRGCGAIVTSRRAIAVNGPRVHLEGLDPAEARALLRGLVSEERADDAGLDRLAERCSYLPLALRIAGTFLALHEDWTLTEYLDALADERQRLQRLRVPDDPELDVAMVLALSVLQLQRERPELAEHWTMLAVFPGGFDRQAAAAVWVVPEDEARDELSALTARSMVLVVDRDYGRYRLHDLMRDVAQGRWRAGEPESDAAARERHLDQAGARHADHFKMVLAAAGYLYRQGSEAVLAGLALFDLERRNIDAGHRWAVARAGTDESADRLISDYAATGWSVLSFRLTPSEQIHWYTNGVDAFRRLRDEPGELHALGALGDAYLAANQLKHAEGCYLQAKLGAQRIGDKGAQATAICSLGRVYTRLEQGSRAIQYYKDAAKMHRRAFRNKPERHYKLGEAQALNQLGSEYRMQQKFEQALKYLHQSLDIAAECGALRDESSSSYNIGLTLCSLGDRESAIAYVKRAYTISMAIRDHQRAGDARIILKVLGSPPSD